MSHQTAVERSAAELAEGDATGVHEGADRMTAFFTLRATQAPRIPAEQNFVARLSLTRWRGLMEEAQSLGRAPGERR